MDGHYGHKMDTAGRVAIPAELRPADDETVRLLLSKRHELPVLTVITQSDFEKRLADIESLKEPGTDRDAPPIIKREMKGHLHSMCRPASINSQGKLQLPKDWAAAAGLAAGEDVMLVGRGQCFELWNTENYAKVLVKQVNLLDAYNAQVGAY